ncbi:MlaD family protein [Nocardia beijingensis]|uniref:MlaD family protein n=1 Tax=Nocardia beijingensis TaxID=95162 RepID=UPI00344D1828
MPDSNRPTKVTRTRMVLAGATIVALVGAGAGVAHHSRTTHQQGLCAQMNDSLGLYPGAAVTVRGIKIGTVTGLNPEGGQVRVDMTISERPLPATVRAVVINNSILTDRRVELVDADPGSGQELAPGTCIGREMTATPIGINDALQAFSTLAEQLSAPRPDGSKPLQDVLTRLGEEFDGTGPTINATLTDLAALTRSPDRFVAELRQILDTMAALTGAATNGWDALRASLPDLGPAFDIVSNLLALFPPLITAFNAADGPMTRLLTEDLPLLTPLVEAAIPLLDLLNNNVTSAKELLAKIPAIVTLFQNMFDKQGAMSLTYVPPQFELPAPALAAVCTQLNVARPGACDPAVTDGAHVPLVQMVLAAIGGRS